MRNAVPREKLRGTFLSTSGELKNQVYMHQHSPHTVGEILVIPMSKYPERCTAKRGFACSAGCNFGALCALWFRGYFELSGFPNSSFLENEDRMKLYQQRLSKKNWREKWEKSDISKNT